MRILDLDLDFFVSDIEHWADGQERADPRTNFPWTELEVRKFLEERCGLNLRNRLPGRFVVNHLDVFEDWKQKIISKKLMPSFEVVHVDAHADLGLGDSAYLYIMRELVTQPPEHRVFAIHKAGDGQCLSSGNYLAYAIACQWISELTYVYHPGSRDGTDLIGYYVGGDRTSPKDTIQIPDYSNVVESEFLFGRDITPRKTEPGVPFKRIPGATYINHAPFDFIYLAQSPSYTPPTADDLIDVICSYFIQEAE